MLLLLDKNLKVSLHGYIEDPKMGSTHKDMIELQGQYCTKMPNKDSIEPRGPNQGQSCTSPIILTNQIFLFSNLGWGVWSLVPRWGDSIHRGVVVVYGTVYNTG